MMADLLPWLNLLLLPGMALLLRINAAITRLQTTQEHHADQLRTLRALPAALAGLQAVQAEHARRLEATARNHPQPT